MIICNDCNHYWNKESDIEKCGYCESASFREGYIVPQENLDPLTEAIEKLNRRAKRLGADDIRCTSKEFKRTVHKKTGRVSIVYEVSIEGTAPKYDGWSFVGTLEPLESEDGFQGNLFKTLPGKKINDWYRQAEGICEHCKKKRQRNETFVVENEQGQQKCVGRNCIKDFLGHKDPKQLVMLAQYLMSAVDHAVGAEGGGGGYTIPQYTVERVLGLTAAVIKRFGWFSKGRAINEGGQSTASHVDHLLTPPTVGSGAYRSWLQDCKEIEKYLEPSEHTAKAALEWILSEEVAKEAEDNDYLTNCRMLAQANLVTSKNLGIACSIVAAYQRTIEKAVEAEKRAALSNEWLGTVDQQLIVTVTVEKVIAIESVYGITQLHVMRDESGNSVKWFCTGSGFDPGQTVRVCGRVKEHETFKDRKQTLLTRVKEHEPVLKLTPSQAAKLEVADHPTATFTKAAVNIPVNETVLAKLKERAELLSGKTATAVMKRINAVQL